jgi:LemA protein
VPNPVETVKGYAPAQRDLDSHPRPRSARPRRTLGETRQQHAHQHARSLFAVAGSPAVAGCENFRHLRLNCPTLKRRSCAAVHNTNVLDYNNRLQTVPTVFIASMFGFTPEEFFEADEEGRAEVRVDFGRDTPAAPPAAGPPADPAGGTGA